MYLSTSVCWGPPTSPTQPLTWVASSLTPASPLALFTVTSNLASYRAGPAGGLHWKSKQSHEWIDGLAGLGWPRVAVSTVVLVLVAFFIC